MALKIKVGSKCVYASIPSGKSGTLKIPKRSDEKYVVIEKKKYGEIYVFEYDGCISTDPNQKKCDYVAELLWKSLVKAYYFIEIKGNKILDAVKQIKNTYIATRKKYGVPFQNIKVYGVIVFSGHARSSFIAKSKDLLKNNNIRLIVKRGKVEIKINVLQNRYH